MKRKKRDVKGKQGELKREKGSMEKTNQEEVTVKERKEDREGKREEGSE